LNWLRQIYIPEAKIISVSKERYRKVKNVLWTLLKVITSIQEMSRSNISTKYFQNVDKILNYVNAVLECLLHLSAIRKQLFNC